MVIDLRLEDQGGGKVIAHAQVDKDDDTPQKGVSVVFTKNGKAAGGQCRVDDDGLATKELTLKVGERTSVTATVAGKRHVTATEVITPEHAKRRATTTTELIISFLFLAVVMTVSYMNGYVGVLFLGLTGALGIMLLQSRGDGEEFVDRLSNNDWVFYTMRGLAIFAFLMFLLGLWVDPPELNPIKAIGNQLKEAMSTELENPWANERWFNSTGFFDGWGMTSLFFLFWMILAYPVSFWDDWVAKSKASTKENKGIIRWLVGTFVHEGVAEALWFPFKHKK